jgi:hypothetical protein
MKKCVQCGRVVILKRIHNVFVSDDVFFDSLISWRCGACNIEVAYNGDRLFVSNNKWEWIERFREIPEGCLMIFREEEL